MKGHETIIQHLNDRLAEELTAINQYFVHAEMTENWNYEKLGDPIKKRSIAEMKHAEALIERILYLEGQPVVSKLNDIRIGAEVARMHANDLDLEVGAVKNYNDSIRVCAELGDDGTKKLLETILNEEEEHVDWLEAQLDQIEQTGIQNYLAQQIY